MPVEFPPRDINNPRTQLVRLFNGNEQISERAINPNIQELCRLTINIH